MADDHDAPRLVVERVAGDELDDLFARVTKLETALRVERAVGEVVAGGSVTLPAIAAALRQRGAEYLALADEIERGG
jgi:hypothetical protein